MEKSELLVNERELVIPGQTLAKGLDYLPSSGSFRTDDEIKAKVLGLVRLKDRFIGIVPLSGVYTPKPGDGVIGFVKDMQSSMWIININSPYDSIMLLGEAVDEYVDLNKTDISMFYDIGDIIYAKVLNVSKAKSVQLTMNDYRARKLIGGRIMKITPFKVPRLIGREGSMIELIKNKTKCQIIVGQNGIVWLKGENETLAAKAIMKIENESHTVGLTNRISELLEKEGE
jgi:exosome complex component RRP4